MGQGLVKSLARKPKALQYLAGALVLLWLRRVLTKLAAWYKHAMKRRKMFLSIPGPPSRSFSLLGAARKMAPEDVPFSTEACTKHLIEELGKLVRSPEFKDQGLLRLTLLNENIPVQSTGKVFVFDIDIAKEMLATRNLDNWEKGLAYKISRPLIGHGVLSTTGDEWAKQRPIVDKGFKSEILVQNMYKIMKTGEEHCAKFMRLAEKSGKGQVAFRAREELLKTTLDVLARVAFSYDIGSITAPTTDDAPLYNAFDNIIRTILGRIQNPLLQLAKNLPMEQNTRFNKDIDKLNAVVDNIIQERLMEQTSGAPRDRPLDLLDILLQGISKEEAKDARSSEMSRQTMIDNIKTLLFAGHDTTASATTWFLYLIAKHPHVAEKIRQEAKEHLGSLSAVPDLEKLERMPFLNACVLEVLRLYPSAAFTRMATRDVVLKGKFTIPKGVEVLIFPYYIQRDERNFKNPNDFIPERWMEEKTGSENLTLQAQLARETMTKAYLPFSLGKRNCAGRALALIEIRLLVLQILDRFDVLLPSREQVERGEYPEIQESPEMTLTLVPPDMQLIYSKRS